MGLGAGWQRPPSPSPLMQTSDGGACAGTAARAGAAGRAGPFIRVWCVRAAGERLLRAAAAGHSSAQSGCSQTHCTAARKEAVASGTGNA